MRTRLIVCCLGLVVTGAGCASRSAPATRAQPSPIRPLQAVALTRLPAHLLAFGQYRSADGDRVCRTRIVGAEYRGTTTQHHAAVPVVATDLVGAVASWLPGAQGTPCRSVRTAIPAAAARKIAKLINGARPFPAGPISCGPADGTQIWLYLRPAHAHGVQKVIVTPDGCPKLGADGLWTRWLPATVMHTLAPYAPPGWTDYLDNGV